MHNVKQCVVGVQSQVISFTHRRYRKGKPIANCCVNGYGNVIFDFHVNLVISNDILIMRIAHMKNHSEVALKTRIITHIYTRSRAHKNF